MIQKGGAGCMKKVKGGSIRKERRGEKTLLYYLDNSRVERSGQKKG